MIDMDDLPENAVAIIGMSCRVPKADNPETFWQNLKQGMHMISQFDDDHLRSVGVDETTINDPNYIKSGAFIENAEMFDANFFDFSPREAEITGPQQRFLLECSYEALQDAGYSADKYAGNIGMFSGTGQGGYFQQNIMTNPDIVKNMGRKTLQFGNELTFSSTQVSYKLNLTGPSVNMATACSTSLVAVHSACKSLLTYECDIALAGAAHISITHDRGYYSPEGGIHSKDGHCRSFDENGSGVVSGNGAGVVVLKRLDEAIEEGDHIDAIILASAINNDGRLKVGFTAPSVQGQSLVIAEAHQLAEIEAEDISYIEAHGTATPMGDPIEIAALTKAFEVSTDKKQFCAVGSLKSNLGHMSAAAGIGSLIKTILALKHQQIPPTLHVENPSPALNLPNTPFYLNTELKDWPEGEAGRIAGISSFGMGGTNAHVIVQEWPQPDFEPSSDEDFQLLTLSAKTPSALETSVNRLKQYLADNDVNMDDLAYTLNMGRDDFAFRTSVVCRSKSEAIDGLEQLFLPEQPALEGSGQNLVFMFAGQGSQHVNMAKALYQSNEYFHQQVDECCQILKPLGIDFIELVYGADSEGNSQLLQQTQYTQACLFVIEYALAKLWLSWGIKPTAMIGHSVGEYVAACLAEVFSLEQALALVVERGRLMQHMPAGLMVSVPMSVAQLEQFVTDKVSIAAVNGPQLTVVSGRVDAIEQFVAGLPDGIETKAVNQLHGFHSYLMDDAIAPFKAALAKCQLNAPQLPFVSNVSGQYITDEQATSIDYWVDHLRGCVAFWPGIEMLMQTGEQVFVDVGPNRVMASLVKQGQDVMASQNEQSETDHHHLIFASLPHVKEPVDEAFFWMNTLGQLWGMGIEIDWEARYEETECRRLRLPTYPFERQRYWIEPNQNMEQLTSLPSELFEDIPVEKSLYVPLWQQVESLTTDCDFLAQQVWLLIGCPEPLLVALRQILTKAVHPAHLSSSGQGKHKVIAVSHAEGYSQLDDETYQIDLTSREHYDILCSDLNSSGHEVNCVIHASSLQLTPFELDGAQVDSQLSQTYFSLLYLQQAMAKHTELKTLHLVTLAQGLCDLYGNGDVNPLSRSLSVLTRVIGQEFEGVNSCYIDLPASFSQSVDLVAEQILTECTHELPQDSVALVGRNRYVEHYGEYHVTDKVQNSQVIRENGVYVITGGLSGIGLELARYITAHYQAKVVLVSRHYPAAEAGQGSHPVEEKIAAMNANGVHAMAMEADVCQVEQLQKLKDKVLEQWGTVNGIIHCAGIAGGGFMELKTKADVDKVFAAKVQGSLNLLSVFEQQPLDFMLMCSSQNALKGGVARADYGAANAFMDGLASYLCYRSTFPVVSVNWCAWRETGMAFENHQQQGDGTAKKQGVTNKEGTELFDLIVKTGLNRVITSKKPFDQVMLEKDAGIKFDTTISKKTKNLQQRPAWLTTKYVAPRNDMEQEIVEIWHDLIGVSPIGVDDQFFELGGNSLLLVQLVMLISKQLGVKLSMQEFLEAPTVARLAEYIVSRSVEDEDLDDLERLLAEFE